MSVETCADAVLVFSCPQEVCELNSCLWKLVLMLSLCFPALSWCVNLVHVCGNFCYSFPGFSFPQFVFELDSFLWKIVLILSLGFSSLRLGLNLVHFFGNFFLFLPCFFL